METIDKYDPKELADECYPAVSMLVGADATHEQKKAAFQKWKLNDQGIP